MYRPRKLCNFVPATHSIAYSVVRVQVKPVEIEEEEEDCKFNCRIVLSNFGSLCSRSIHIICSLIAEDFARIIVNPIFAPYCFSSIQSQCIFSVTIRYSSSAKTAPVTLNRADTRLLCPRCGCHRSRLCGIPWACTWGWMIRGRVIVRLYRA